jgi:glycosyltransferase involved in cell wall biosynthesis
VRIAHISTVHSATDLRIFAKECRSLQRAGHDVSFVVPHPRDEVRDGVRILGVRRRSGRLGRFSRTGLDLLRRAIADGAAACHLHDPDLLPFIVPLKLAGKRVVYDAHEDLPKEILSKPWIPPALRAGVSWTAGNVELLATRFADAIVAATPSIARRFPRSKTVVVQNFPLPEELVAVNGGTAYAHRPLMLAYVGGLSAIRGAREMIEALERIPASVPLRLAFAGRFENAAIEQDCRARPGWARVDPLGFIGRAEVAALLGKSRAGVVLFLPEPNHLEAYPTKLFEYMSAGIPVIASDFPLWREIVEEVGCGVLADPLDPAAIARAVSWIIDHPAEAAAMGERGRAAVLQRFAWPFEEQKLLRLYDSLGA